MAASLPQAPPMAQLASSDRIRHSYASTTKSSRHSRSPDSKHSPGVSPFDRPGSGHGNTGHFQYGQTPQAPMNAQGPGYASPPPRHPSQTGGYSSAPGQQFSQQMYGQPQAPSPYPGPGVDGLYGHPPLQPQRRNTVPNICPACLN